MKKLPFEIEPVTLRGTHDSAWLSPVDEDDLPAALRDAVIDAVHLDVEVTVGDVTMFLAAWEDPDHWATDWAEKLGVGYDDAPAAVAALLTEAVFDDD